MTVTSSTMAAPGSIGRLTIRTTPTATRTGSAYRSDVDAADTIAVKESLQTNQAAVVVGNTVPLIFCREVTSVGGVMVSPPAVRCGFQVPASGLITVNYLCVLSEGELSAVSSTDVWLGGRKISTLDDDAYEQTYGGLPSTIALYNDFYVGDDAFVYPSEIGSGGSLAGLSLAGVRATYPVGGAWASAVHCFVRSGVSVVRLLDSSSGPSNNFADLVLYLLRSTGRMPEDLIDSAALLTAAEFTDTAGLHFNGVLAASTSMRDYLSKVAPLFLLMVSNVNGKTGLRPVLPITGGFAIDTGVITPAVTYGMEDMVIGSYQQQYTPLSDRKFFRCVMSWRQQVADEAPVITSVIVGYTGYATEGPYETYDLSDFCVAEAHAIKVGRYILAKRRYSTHTISFTLLPGAASREPGDIIRVTLNRISSAGAAFAFSRLYQVVAVTKEPTGEMAIDAEHFPVDADGKSLIAAEINTTAIRPPVNGEDQCPPPTPAEEPDPPPAGTQLAAYGGTVTTSGGYRIHTFTGNGSFVVTNAPSGSEVEYLIAGAGGRGGGSSTSGVGGGGGGGGQVRTGTVSVTAQSYSVTVGSNAATQGGSSSALGLTSIGGGRGSSTSLPVTSTMNGASGGGGNSVTLTAGTGSAGNNGAAGSSGSRGGGGGGAGGAPSGATGGAGVSSSISGTSVSYGGGGTAKTSNGAGTDGTANRGQGGGGGYGTISSSPTVYANGGLGGTGVVIIRYLYS